MSAIRERSLKMTRKLIDAAVQRGWRVNTPPADADRGGTVVIDDIDVTNAHGATIAVFRGKSARIKGHVIAGPAGHAE